MVVKSRRRQKKDPSFSHPSSPYAALSSILYPRPPIPEPLLSLHPSFPNKGISLYSSTLPVHTNVPYGNTVIIHRTVRKILGELVHLYFAFAFSFSCAFLLGMSACSDLVNPPY